MLSLVRSSRKPTRAWRQRFEDWARLEQCVGLTRAQRLTRAFLWASIGALLWRIAAALISGAQPEPPVRVLDPIVAHADETYTSYVLRLEWRGAQKSCELIVFHDRQTWRLTCPPR